ncbi:MAG: hypothetical protein RMJ98_16735 [Myxococcales bacterium]|nr:hypothetical protein [Myxococcales bacterium]
MNTNRGYRDRSPAFPGTPGSNQKQEDWGVDPEEDVFDRPTIIPNILPTEADLMAGKLPPAHPPPAITSTDEEWGTSLPIPPFSASATVPDPVVPPEKHHASGNLELELDLDDLGAPSSAFASPRGPGKATPISFNNLAPFSPRSTPAPHPLSTHNLATTQITPPARPALQASLLQASTPSAATASPHGAPPPRPPVPTRAEEDSLPFDLQLPSGLETPRRESIPDDFDLDLEAVRNPKIQGVPSMPPLTPPEEGEESHTAPYPFDLDPSDKKYAVGHFRQPPPVASPTSPLDELDHLLEEEQPRPGKLKPMMGEPWSPNRVSLIEQHMRDMRDRFALGDFSGSLKAAEALLTISPGNAEAQRFVESCQGRLRGMYEAKLGSLAGVPRVILPPDQVRWLSLDHRAGFLLSCIDGHSSVEDILDVSGMPAIDALRILHDLLVQKVIAVSLVHRWRAALVSSHWRPPLGYSASCWPSCFLRLGTPRGNPSSLGPLPRPRHPPPCSRAP